ncbi:hypothetical protein QUF64_12900 [Anaerolineales bacterium HSG6]|nr:hypothetical protein [Anaerolineales bacterium HSG6]
MAELSIRFTGSHLKPEQVSARELGNLIASVEDMVASIILQDAKEEQKRDDVRIGLKALTTESIGLQYVIPDNNPQYQHALGSVVYVFQKEDFRRMPRTGLRPARRIVRFLKKHRCEAQVKATNGRLFAEFTITERTKIIKSVDVIGKTTLYGVVDRVGGKETKARFETVQGQRLNCKVASRDLARQLGERLYTKVGLQGTAKWFGDTMELHDFIIEALTNGWIGPFNRSAGQLNRCLG